MKDDLQGAVDERLAQCIEWARDRGRSWAAEMFVCENNEDTVRLRARLSALSEAEEAQSSTGDLFRGLVGAIARLDIKGNRRCLLS
jgi:hypothetical protein